jgi:hypothetical protein
MLNNLTNFFNLLTTRKIKTTIDPSDLVALGVYDPRTPGVYQPAAILACNLQGIPVTPSIVVLGAGSCSTQRCGMGNNASGVDSTALGRSNVASGCFSTTSGMCNTASGAYSTVFGSCNRATAGATTALGYNNLACGFGSSVLGGQASVANNGGVVVGGFLATSTDRSFVGQAAISNATAEGAVITGGANNNATGQVSFVGTGFNNTASAAYTGILGGGNNTASSRCSFIIGSDITTDRVCTTFVNALSMKTIPTSTAGLPSGMVWRCTTDNILRIIP